MMTTKQLATLYQRALRNFWKQIDVRWALSSEASDEEKIILRAAMSDNYQCLLQLEKVLKRLMGDAALKDAGKNA
jgi:hypothetical protein